MNRQSVYLYSILILFSLIIIVPIYTTIIGGFKSIGELRVNIIGLPESWIFDNYFDILFNSKFWSYISNSILYAALTVFLTVFLSSMAAFVFAHIHFLGSKFLFNYLLLGLLFPFATAILPLFLRVRDLELLGTVWAVVLPQVAFNFGFAILLFRGFFKELPKDLFDSAFIDGCTYTSFYFRITLPLSLPIIATVSVIALINSWNNYLLPLIMINEENLYPWPLGIMVFRGEYMTDWPKILAYVSLTLLPAVGIFLAAQKYIISGLTSGSIKE